MNNDQLAKIFWCLDRTMRIVRNLCNHPNREDEFHAINAALDIMNNLRQEFDAEEARRG